MQNHGYKLPAISLDLIRADIRACGLDDRFMQLDEECKELGLAISHYRRSDRAEGVEGKGGVAEELADVIVLWAVVSCGLRDLGYGPVLDEMLHTKVAKWKRHITAALELAAVPQRKASNSGRPTA